MNAWVIGNLRLAGLNNYFYKKKAKLKVQGQPHMSNSMGIGLTARFEGANSHLKYCNAFFLVTKTVHPLRRQDGVVIYKKRMTNAHILNHQESPVCI